MPGIVANPSGTLVDRALTYLATGPADSLAIAREVLGLPTATPAIADRVAVALLGAHPAVRRLVDTRWSLSRDSAGSPAIESCTFAVVDVETTGSRAGGRDRIIEIAVAVLARGRVDLVFDALVNPGRPIARYVHHLTGITDEMVRSQPRFAEIAGRLVAALAGRVFVAHNMRFDWAFVSSELRDATDRVLEGPRLCTVQLARRLVTGLKSRGLDNLARYFGIENTARHRAGGDAVATARILQCLLDLAAERGARTLDDLTALGRRRRRKRKKRSAMAHPIEEVGEQ